MPLEDNFKAPLESHTSDSGHSWTTLQDQHGYIAGIQPNDTFHQSSWTPSSPDYSVTLDLVNIGTPTAATVFAIGRWTGDDTGPYYAAVFDNFSSGKKLRLIKVIGANESELASAILAEAPSQLMWSASGNLITAMAGGDILTVPDSSITDAGFAGMYGNGNVDRSNGIIITKITTA